MSAIPTPSVTAAPPASPAYNPELNRALAEVQANRTATTPASAHILVEAVYGTTHDKAVAEQNAAAAKNEPIQQADYDKAVNKAFKRVTPDGKDLTLTTAEQDIRTQVEGEIIVIRAFEAHGYDKCAPDTQDFLRREVVGMLTGNPMLEGVTDLDAMAVMVLRDPRCIPILQEVMRSRLNVGEIDAGRVKELAAQIAHATELQERAKQEHAQTQDDLQARRNELAEYSTTVSDSVSGTSRNGHTFEQLQELDRTITSGQQHYDENKQRIQELNDQIAHYTRLRNAEKTSDELEAKIQSWNDRIRGLVEQRHNFETENAIHDERVKKREQLKARKGQIQTEIEELSKREKSQGEEEWTATQEVARLQKELNTASGVPLSPEEFLARMREALPDAARDLLQQVAAENIRAMEPALAKERDSRVEAMMGKFKVAFIEVDGKARPEQIEANYHYLLREGPEKLLVHIGVAQADLDRLRIEDPPRYEALMESAYRQMLEFYVTQGRRTMFGNAAAARITTSECLAIMDTKEGRAIIDKGFDSDAVRAQVERLTKRNIEGKSGLMQWFHKLNYSQQISFLMFILILLGGGGLAIGGGGIGALAAAAVGGGFLTTQMSK